VAVTTTATATAAAPRAAWTAPPVAAVEEEEAAVALASAGRGALMSKVLGVGMVLPYVSWAREYYETGGISFGTLPGPNGPEEIGLGTHNVLRQTGTVPDDALGLTPEVAERILHEGDYFMDISFVWKGGPMMLWRIIHGKAINTGYHFVPELNTFVKHFDHDPALDA
jgi:hypothetical protein